MGNINDLLLYFFFIIFLITRFKDSRNFLPELVDLSEDSEGRRLAKGGAGGGIASSGFDSVSTPAMFEGSYLSDFLNFELPEIAKVAFMGFLHIVLLLTATFKIVLFLKIYEAFQELVLVLQTCLFKVVPFSCLIYFWILICSCMFRILGSDNGDPEEM